MLIISRITLFFKTTLAIFEVLMVVIDPWPGIIFYQNNAGSCPVYMITYCEKSLYATISNCIALAYSGEGQRRRASKKIAWRLKTLTPDKKEPARFM